MTKNMWAGAMLAVFMLSASAQADKAAARKIFESHRDAIVTVSLTVKSTASFGGVGEDEESVTEATGTTIRPDGLTVLSLSETDPMALLSSMMPAEMSGMFSMNSEVSTASMIVGDGREIDAEIVLRDKDLDLAFVRPTEAPSEPLPYIDLSDGATLAELDDVVILGRLGKIANRAHSVSLGTVTAVVQRPRQFYVTSGIGTDGSFGSPAFTLGGTPVGIYVMRTLTGVSPGGSGLGAMMGAMENVLPILLPAVDILEGAKQAPEFGESDASAEDASSAE